MTNKSLIDLFQSEIDRLETYDVHRKLNSDALGQIAGLNTAISIYREYARQDGLDRKSGD